jgi:hypothetical protein
LGITKAERVFFDGIRYRTPDAEDLVRAVGLTELVRENRNSLDDETSSCAEGIATFILSQLLYQARSKRLLRLVLE